MSVNLSTPFQEGDPVSAAKRNATAVISDRGSNLTAIPVNTLIPVVRCIETSGGLKINELYFRSADLLSWINVRRQHLHNANSDESGGLHHEVLVANPKIVSFGNEPFNHVDDFLSAVQGTATITNLADELYGRTIYLYSTWDSELLQGNAANLSAAGLPISFTEKIAGYASLWMAFNANQVARVGFGMENAQNTVDITSKLGMEMCSSTGINWQMVTANGLARTVSASSINAAPVPNNLKTYRFFFNPYTAEFKLSSSDGITKVMTSTIPSGGMIENKRLFRIGLNTTNATAKQMWVMKVKFNAITAEPTYYNNPEGV